MLTFLLSTLTPTPSSTPYDPDLITPGPLGFLIVVFIGVAVIFLIWDMLRRIRRARYRDEINQKLDEEQRADSQSD